MALLFFFWMDTDQGGQFWHCSFYSHTLCFPFLSPASPPFGLGSSSAFTKVLEQLAYDPAIAMDLQMLPSLIGFLLVDGTNSWKKKGWTWHLGA
jgi:hypothetical protein